MKKISFSDQELEYMISSYVVELSYAEDEVARIKEILKKIETAKKVKEDKITTPIAKKRGRKPKVTLIEKAEGLLTSKPELKEKFKAKKQSKGKPVIKDDPKARTKKMQPIEKVLLIPETKPVTEKKPAVKKVVTPKKKKLKKSYGKKGVVLANLVKALPIKPAEPI